MMTDLKGKTALVTGSGKKTGMGYAMARKLASLGTNVIIADLGDRKLDGVSLSTGSTAEMEEIARGLEHEFGIAAITVQLDVTDNESINRGMETAKGRFGHIDILCNNAGASFGVPNAVHTYDESA